MMVKYIIITPLKNEIKNLPEFTKTVREQTIPPHCWIFVDDWSDDGSYEYLLNLLQKCQWIKVIRTKEKKKREMGFHYAAVVKTGFDYLVSNSIDYDYISVLDADILIPNNYYEELIKRFEADPNLGIASGIVVCTVGKRRIWEKEPPEWPCGAARLWKRECFEMTGWEITRAPDSVSTAKAMLAGFKTMHFKDLMVEHLRPTWSGSGFWYGFMDLGKTRYYLGYDPLFIVIASFKYTIDYPHTGTIPFLIGYFGDFFKYEKRIENKTVIDFFKRRMVDKVKHRIERHFRKSDGH
ncbi:MAG: glycosyltransferase family 2 protein [bacterium]